jgi:hypothetical protein
VRFGGLDGVLSIGKLAKGQADYYLQLVEHRIDRLTSVASGVEDDYLGGGEAAGEWILRGRCRLGCLGRSTASIFIGCSAGRIHQPAIRLDTRAALGCPASIRRSRRPRASACFLGSATTTCVKQSSAATIAPYPMRSGI